MKFVPKKSNVLTLLFVLTCLYTASGDLQAGPTFSHEKGDYADSEFDLTSSTYSHIRKVSRVGIKCGAMVDSLEFWGSDADGREFSLGEHCGGVGGGYNEIRLHDGEYIMGFEGYNGRVLDQLFIKTNKNTYGPYGNDNGARAFSITLEHPLRVWKAHARGLGNNFLVEWFRCGDGTHALQQIKPN